MKRLKRTAQDYTGENFSSYHFLDSLNDSRIPDEQKQYITAGELAETFKNWYVQNWIDQGNDPQELKYIGLLPEEVFYAWVYTNTKKYSNLFDSTLDQAKFLLKSERILR